MLLLICNRELMFILSEKHRQDNASTRVHHDSDWNYVNRADQNRVPNLSRARFDYKRKDEDDMAKSTKTYEERIRALERERNRKASKLPKAHCTAKGTGKEKESRGK